MKKVVKQKELANKIANNNSLFFIEDNSNQSDKEHEEMIIKTKKIKYNLRINK